MYPNSLFATGGAAGNSLFFALSGYFLSFEIPFYKWFFNKLKKLYIPTIIATLLTFKLRKNFTGIVFQFIWPTEYWFIGALLIFIVVTYFLQLSGRVRHHFLLTVVFLSIYFLYYAILIDKTFWNVEAIGLTSVSGFFKLIYYYYIYLTAYYIKRYGIKVRVSKILLVMASLISFIFPLGFKFLLLKGLIPMSMQFITQLCNIVFAISCLQLGILCEDRYRLFFSEIVRNTCNRLSNLSLYVYLMQVVVIKSCKRCIFPINVMLAIVGTFCFAFVLAKICDKVLK